MYRVLIAEDEDIIIRGMINLIEWDKIGLSVCGTAGNGEEALKKYNELKPDIILTDINMPVMSGLDFLKKVREVDERVRFIILSGYDNFSYAQQAIPLNVEQYILKPIDAESLTGALRSSAEFLKKWDIGEKDLSQKESFLRFFEIMPYDKAVMACLKVKKKVTGSVKTKELLEYLEKKYAGRGWQIIAFEQEDFLFAVPYEKRTVDSLKDVFEELIEDIDAKFHVSAFVSIGNPYDVPYGQIDAYKEVKTLSRYVLVMGYGKVISPEYAKNRHFEDVQFDERYLEKLLIAGDLTGAKKYIDDLFIEKFDPKETASDSIYRLSIKMALYITKLSDEYKIKREANDTKDLTDLVLELLEVDDVEKIKTILMDEMVNIAEKLDSKNIRYSPIIVSILDELEKDSGADVNLKTLAAKHNMNCSYLGQLFLKEVGMHFVQYINVLRNNKAKNLLLLTDKTINDIAEEVGYANVSYFHTKFKEQFGISPASIRRINH